MIRVLYLNATAELGGTDTDLLATIAALDRARFAPWVVLPHPGPLDAAYRALEVPLHYLPLAVVNRRAASPTGLARLLAGGRRSVRSLARLIREQRIDLVYTNSLLVLDGGLAARLTGRPALWHSGEIFGGPVGRALYTAVGALADRIIVSSAAVRRQFGARHRPKVEVLHNGIDLRRFAPGAAAPARREFGIPPDTPVIGWVGRFVPWKGPDLFLRACAQALADRPEAAVLMVGSVLAGYERYAAEITALGQRLGLGGRLHIAQSRLDVPALLAAMDVVVHSSVKPEPFGIVIVEALAMGKPVIAVDAGGVPEIITSPDVGVLTPLGDGDALAAAIATLLDDPARRAALGGAARGHALARFEIGAVTRRAERIYEQALARRPHKPARREAAAD